MPPDDFWDGVRKRWRDAVARINDSTAIEPMEMRRMWPLSLRRTTLPLPDRVTWVQPDDALRRATRPDLGPTAFFWQIDIAGRYYLPHPKDVASAFHLELRRLVNYLGEARLSRVVVVPAPTAITRLTGHCWWARTSGGRNLTGWR